MKRKWKITIGVVVLLIAAGGGLFAYKYSQRGIVTVQTGKTVRQDLSAIVTASGEIKPRNYINIGANTLGPARIVDIYVKEGDRVRRNQVVAKLDATQAAADVAAQKAAVRSAEADSAASEAAAKAADDAIATAKATLERTKADLQRLKVDYDRSAALVKDKLIAQQDYDQKKALYEAQRSAVVEAETRVNQAVAQKQQLLAQETSSQRRIVQIQASLNRAADVLDKYNTYSPIDGVVTNLPVRVGETVVPGIQNSAASTLMTIADMSIITAEVKVDETDIVNVKLDQPAEVTVDAIPNKTFKGHVIEIGNTAILRSSGVAASQSAVSSQEAKDFKVVVALDNPTDELRPGLSCTSKITTATRQHVLTIPLQALTMRQRGDLVDKPEGGNVVNAAPNPAQEKINKEELQGVFVTNNGKAEFRKVDTGITGATDIEVTNGLKDGDEIITGSYKVIKTLRNNAKIKIDNRPPAAGTQPA